MVKFERESVGLPFLRAQELTKPSNVTIQNEGEYRDNPFGRRQLVFAVKNGSGTYQWAPTPGVLNAMADAWGEDTKKWMGKKVRVRGVVLESGKLAGKHVIEGTPVA